MAWKDDLQSASWRGVPFFVDVAETLAGRNTAIHTYPYRVKDPAWVEDLGLAPTPTRIIGFLIGDDVADQHAGMLAAMQVKGPGDLVHPLRGVLTGSVLGGCRFIYRKDRGRYIEISFEFIESSATPFPASTLDTQGAIGALVGSAKDSVLGNIAGSLGSGLQQAQSAVREVQAVARQALSIAGSASSLARSVPGLSGSFGRFSGVSGVLSSVSQASSALSRVSSAANAIAGAPAMVSSTISKVERLAAQLT